MTNRYIDTRPKAPDCVFEHVNTGIDYVELKNLDNNRRTMVQCHDFRQNYEPIRW